MVNLLSNVAIQDASNTSNIVYLDNIMTGVDGAATFGYSITPTALQVNDNQRQQYKHDHQLDIRVLRASGADLTKLQAIAGGSGRVNMAALTIDDSILLWGGSDTVTKPILTYKPQHDEVIADQILLTETTLIGYCDGADGLEYPVFAGDNLLAKYAYGVNPDGTVYGFTQGDGVNGLTPPDFYNLSNGLAIASRLIYLPFPGKILHFGFTVDNFEGSPGDSGQIEMQISFYNASAGLISSSTVTITGTPGTGGVNSDSVTIPAGTAFIEVVVENVGDDACDFGKMFVSLSKQEYTPF